MIGGSVAGLLAARVLADYFRRVIVLERDPLPTQPDARKRVPQGRHAHALLVRGEQIVNRYFPGIRNQLLNAELAGSDDTTLIRHHNPVQH